MGLNEENVDPVGGLGEILQSLSSSSTKTRLTGLSSLRQQLAKEGRSGILRHTHNSLIGA